MVEQVEKKHAKTVIDNITSEKWNLLIFRHSEYPAEAFETVEIILHLQRTTEQKLQDRSPANRKWKLWMIYLLVGVQILPIIWILQPFFFFKTWPLTLFFNGSLFWELPMFLLCINQTRTILSFVFNVFFILRNS